MARRADGLDLIEGNPLTIGRKGGQSFYAIVETQRGAKELTHSPKLG
jgi:hypothetical protein